MYIDNVKKWWKKFTDKLIRQRRMVGLPNDGLSSKYYNRGKNGVN